MDLACLQTYDYSMCGAPIRAGIRCIMETYTFCWADAFSLASLLPPSAAIRSSRSLRRALAPSCTRPVSLIMNGVAYSDMSLIQPSSITSWKFMRSGQTRRSAAKQSGHPSSSTKKRTKLPARPASPALSTASMASTKSLSFLQR